MLLLVYVVVCVCAMLLNCGWCCLCMMLPVFVVGFVCCCLCAGVCVVCVSLCVFWCD